MPDTGILCILLLARFFGLPADGAQLRHQFGQSGKPLDDADLLRAAKSLDLKAGIVRTDMAHLAGTPLPAIAKRHDGRYVIIAKVEGETAPGALPPRAWVSSAMAVVKRAGCGFW